MLKESLFLHHFSMDPEGPMIFGYLSRSANLYRRL